MYVFTSRIEVPPEQAGEFESRFVVHLCSTFTEVPGLASAELGFPRDDDSRHAVVLEFTSERSCAEFGDADRFGTVFFEGSWVQDGAWRP